MKTKCLVFIGMLISTFMWTSCDNDDHPTHVSDAIKNTFYNQFPSANRVEWEMKRGYYVAEFWDNADMEAWYDANGRWAMTETDLGRNVEALPQAIINTINGSDYNMWLIDNIDKYERQDMTFYTVEVETVGKPERKLFFTTDGTLLKDMPDRENDDVYPDTAF